MNVLLCGASGFIGRHVLAALRAAGHRRMDGAPGRMAADHPLAVGLDRAVSAGRRLLAAGAATAHGAAGGLRGRQRRTLAARLRPPAGTVGGLGYPAFIAMLAVYWLMVNKPALF